MEHVDDEYIDGDVTPLEVVHAMLNEIDGIEASENRARRSNADLAVIGSRVEGKPLFYVDVHKDVIAVSWETWSVDERKFSLNDPQLQDKLAALAVEIMNEFKAMWQERALQAESSLAETQKWIGRAPR